MLDRVRVTDSKLPTELRSMPLEMNNNKGSLDSGRQKRVLPEQTKKAINMTPVLSQQTKKKKAKPKTLPKKQKQAVESFESTNL